MAGNNVGLQIMTVNVDGPGDVDIRRDNFPAQLGDCDVIFLQECTGLDRPDLLQTAGNVQIRPRHGDNGSDIAIIWRENIFENVTVVRNDRITGIINEKKLFKQMIARRDDMNNRLKVIRVTLNQQFLYFASWHGPYNGFSDRQKIICYENLIQLMQTLSGRHPFIIGGDFNIIVGKIWRIERENGVRVHHSPPRRRGNIDYFVSGNLENFQIENWQIDRIVNDIEIFDHQPVEATLTIAV